MRKLSKRAEAMINARLKLKIWIVCAIGIVALGFAIPLGTAHCGPHAHPSKQHQTWEGQVNHAIRQLETVANNTTRYGRAVMPALRILYVLDSQPKCTCKDDN